MNCNINAKYYKSYLLLLEKDLELEELKVIFNEEEPSKLLQIVCSSLFAYLDDLKENNELISSKYLDNLKVTIINMLSICRPSNIGISLNNLKKLERRINKLEENFKLKKYIDEFEDLFIHKLNESFENDNYDFLCCIIYEIKSIHYLKQILNTYPHYLNTRNHQNKHIVLELIDKLLELLEQSNDEDIMYYNSVILEFVNRTRFHISSNELKQYCLKLDILIRGLNKHDENYNKKFSFYKSILNHLLNNEANTENIEIINSKYGIKQTFNIAVQDELKKLNEKDYIITIDSDETLDMDDAMSIKKINDYYHLKVYIADVARTIKMNSEIDKEALRRCETLYLSDLIVPMLPTELSNDLLSLNTRSYKNVICFECDIYENGDITNFKINKSNILIDKNFTYDEVDYILKYGDMDYRVYETLNNLSEVATILKNKNAHKIIYRLVEDYTKVEKKIDRQKNNYKDRTTAEIIIEEIMILFNILTSEYFKNENYPFMYRVHPTCDLKDEYQSLINLKETISLTNIDRTNKIKLINNLINMYPSAYYSFENIGHFGLGQEQYCHATSPIRRYPDIIIQRLIYDYIFSNPSKEKDLFWEIKIKELCVYCNERMMQNKLYQNEYEQTKALIKKLSC